MVVLGCERMDCVIQSESYHDGRMKKTMSGLRVVVEEAIACRAAFAMSSGSFCELARQDPSYRYRKVL